MIGPREQPVGEVEAARTTSGPTHLLRVSVGAGRPADGSGAATCRACRARGRRRRSPVRGDAPPGADDHPGRPARASVRPRSPCG